MADRRVTRTYVEGNTVRREVEYRHVPEMQEEKVLSNRVRRNRAKLQRIGAPSLITLILATILMLGTCVSYLEVQSSITTHRNSIEKLENRLQTLKADNDALEAHINTSLNLEHIRYIAMSELGMVYPTDDQLIYYEKTESGYVRQNEDIPTN